VVVDRRTLTVLGILVLGVLALGLSAATLTSSERPSGDSGPDTGSGGGPDVEQADPDATDPLSLDAIQPLVLAVAGLLLFASLVYMALFERRWLVASLAVFAGILLFGLVTQDIELQPFVSNETGTGQPGDGAQPGAGASDQGGGGESDRSPVSALLLTVVFLALLLVAYSTVGRAVGDSRAASTETEGAGSEEPSVTSLGEIAGRAADRIEADTDRTAADNEIYRAWEEMTTRLDIEREATTTPREFETRAVEAGLAPDDVRELTALFETVRYGGEAVTDDRERRAVTVLRRIESRYGAEQ
jgi:hypothetical protein